MRIAVLQAEATVLNIESNLALLEDAAARASSGGASILLTPELFTVGYAPKLLRAGLEESVLPSVVERLAQIAAKHKIALLYSLPQRGDTGWHITSTFVDDSGKMLANYVKVHLFGTEELQAFVPGSLAATVLDYRGIRLGLAICFDIEFPEVVREAAVRGVQLLLVPTALGVGYERVCTTLVPARAMENQLYVAYANHTGTQNGFALAGTSVIAGPDGELLAGGGTEPELLFADIKPRHIAEAQARVPYLNAARPDLYRQWAQERP